MNAHGAAASGYTATTITGTRAARPAGLVRLPS